jgi:hypothetical protein
MLTYSKNPSRSGFERISQLNSNTREQEANNMGCGSSKCDCKFDGKSETVQAIRAHLDKQYLGPFHLQTTWQVVLIVLGLELLLYGLYKLYLYRKKKRETKKFYRGQYLTDYYGHNQQQKGNHYQIPTDMGYPGAPPRYSYPGQRPHAPTAPPPPPMLPQGGQPIGYRHQAGPPNGDSNSPPHQGGQAYSTQSGGQPQGGKGNDPANAQQQLNDLKK